MPGQILVGQRLDTPHQGSGPAAFFRLVILASADDNGDHKTKEYKAQYNRHPKEDALKRVDGELQIESRPGAGSTFTCRFPLARLSGAAQG